MGSFSQSLALLQIMPQFIYRKALRVFRLALILALLLCLKVEVVAVAQSNPSPSKTAKLEKLFGDGVFTEAVAVAPSGTVYFCDITLLEPQTLESKRLLVISLSNWLLFELIRFVLE